MSAAHELSPDVTPVSVVKASLDVLVVDDDDGARRALEDAVTSLGHRCRAACDGEEALALHRAEPADVIVSDYDMPRMDGAELCRQVRALGSEPYTYFVFMTGFEDKEHFIKGMEAGADDYHTKPVDLDELCARLASAQRVLGVYQMLAAQNASLKRDSQTSFRDARLDALTEIPNRLRLKEDLEAIRAHATRYGHRYCLALCDLDDFKKYNDHFGHLAGDHALRAIASTLRDELRTGDSLYRYGGEEFLIILPEQSLDEAKRALDRLRSAVERLGIPVFAGPPAPGGAPRLLTLSAGVAELEDPTRIEDWIAKADAALYRAKELGKNRVELARGDS